MLTEKHEAPTERTEIKVGHDAQHCVWILAETNDGQTVRIRYTNKEALSHASNVVDAVNIVHRANGLREYEIRQLATTPPDPRPSDMAELARLVAVELRKRGTWARVNIWHNVEIGECAYSLLFSDFDNLGPVGCADAIQSLEATRAQEWAGDK